MARAPLTEWKAKQILMGAGYAGMHVAGVVPRLHARKRYVVKVDEGVKKRMKKGLVQLDCNEKEIKKHIARWKKLGYTSFLIEEMFPHTTQEERYIALERVRDGIRVSYSTHGGIDIENHADAVISMVVRAPTNVHAVADKLSMPRGCLESLYAVMNEGSIAFLEINPCIIRKNNWTALDCAVLVDTTITDSSLWSESDVISKPSTKEEARVMEIQKTTPASLKLKVMNRQGSLFFLLSGGGGSLVVMDTVASEQCAHLIGNYGEYSGNPSQEETYLYTREVLSLLIASRAKKKALVIAGGIANFTDIKETFTGVIRAIAEVSEVLKKHNIRIYVRRGGPNEDEGLRRIRAFFRAQNINHAVYGSETPLSVSVLAACAYVRKK